jgi:translation initiation factor 1
MRLFAGTPFDQPPTCRQCENLQEDCTCPSTPAEVQLIPPALQTAHLCVEKRKQGKMVTVIRGLPADGNDLARLVTELKSQCGAGGTVKGDVLEIQGNHLDRVSEHLRLAGYRLKR